MATEVDAVRTDAGVEEICLACATVLNQCHGLVGGLTDRAFNQPSAVLRGGTIGKHLRHLLDHVVVATRGVTCVEGECLDYDHRTRGGDVESDRAAARKAIEDASARLAELDEEALATEVSVRFMFNGRGDQAVVRSTVGRELAFAMHHAIHHQAMMRAIAVEQGIEVPEAFGKAPDTVRHEAGER